MSSSNSSFRAQPKGIPAKGWSCQTSERRKDARSLVTPRQAWQFGVVPLALAGGQLTFATSESRRSRAERFVRRVLGVQPDSQVLDEPTLSACLDALYPLGGALHQFQRAKAG
jgi:hypothetical protein